MIRKYFHALVGFVLLMFYRKKIKLLSIFKNKRIAIVGPAASAFEKETGEIIDNYDLVIRINKAPYLLNEMNRAFIGARTDILFHSFFENEFTGGGKLDFEFYKKSKITMVVNPIPGRFGWRGIFNFYKKYRTGQVVYHARLSNYKSILKELKGFRPTTGFMALYYALQSDFAELFITGFTFFKTPYMDGYRDHVKDVATNKTFMEKEKQHQADAEFDLFLKLYRSGNQKQIHLDDALSKIIQSTN